MASMQESSTRFSAVLLIGSGVLIVLSLIANGIGYSTAQDTHEILSSTDSVIAEIESLRLEVQNLEEETRGYQSE